MRVGVLPPLPCASHAAQQPPPAPVPTAGNGAGQLGLVPDAVGLTAGASSGLPSSQANPPKPWQCQLRLSRNQQGDAQRAHCQDQGQASSA
eukprot:5967649-Pyramimonas_sp.AAC.1